MPYAAPATVVTATTITSAWGNSVKAATDYLANPPSCRVHQTGAQAITAATETAITFTGERYDTDTMHDTVTNTSRITIKTAGLYVVGGHVYAGATASGIREVFIRKNANTYDALTGVITANAQGIALSTIAKYAVNDYIELRVNFAVANNTTVGATFTSEFFATWIGLG